MVTSERLVYERERCPRSVEEQRIVIATHQAVERSELPRSKTFGIPRRDVFILVDSSPGQLMSL